MVNISKKLFIHMFLLCLPVSAQTITFPNQPELFMPDIVSTGVTEVKVTFSPKSELIMWGAIGKPNGMGGFDIWYIAKSDTGWEAPKPAAFNSDSNDFDPCFSPDGKGVYFFSNRAGGYGGDDLYFVSYDPVMKSFGAPVNLGPEFNTPKDEWGPCISPNGRKLIYCTDGFIEIGKHDLYISYFKDTSWSKPECLTELNSPTDDFDPVFLHDNSTIVFSRMQNEDEVYLYYSFFDGVNYRTPVKLPETVNASGTWNFGSSLNPSEPGTFYISSHRKENTRGRIDIYRVPYTIER